MATWGCQERWELLHNLVWKSHVAMPSSPISPLVRIPLSEVLVSIPDPRDPRGIRHRLETILACAISSVLAGAKTLVEVEEWVHQAGPERLRSLGMRAEEKLPSEATIRRTLARLDPDDLDTRIGAWMATRIGLIAGRRVIAIDGKSMRGAVKDGLRPHLLGVLDHDHRVVLAQRAVPDKTSEIPALRDLLSTMDITGVVVTADALHCQRATAESITSQGGHYVLTVKANQPSLRNGLKGLPWADIPGHTYLDQSHGRRVRRTVKAVTMPTWIDWPGAAQVLQIRRTRTIKGRRSVEVVYVITSVPMDDASPREVTAWVQGHWTIENALHWVRDVTFNEDHHQLRTGAGPQVMATLRNTAISLLRLAGWNCIAAGLRHHHADATRPVTLLTTA